MNEVQTVLLWLPEQVEAELRELDPVEAAEYLESLGAKEGGLASLIRAAYSLLGLRTYFTTGSLPVPHHSPVALRRYCGFFRAGLVRASTTCLANNICPNGTGDHGPLWLARSIQDRGECSMGSPVRGSLWGCLVNE